MPARERVRRRRVGWLLAVAAVGAIAIEIAMLAAHNVALSRRVDALEAAVAERDAVDPLVASECMHSPRFHGEIVGLTRDKPCDVPFQRLIDAPRQFQGRWVSVDGVYIKAYERSELHPPDSNGSADSGRESNDRLLWVDVPVHGGQGEVTVVGRFRRGPAGHLSAYFASLNDQ